MRRKNIIIPSIIAKTQDELNEKLNKLEWSEESEEIELIHLDIMNDTFVSNSSLDFDFILNDYDNIKFEAHLMIDNPIEWIEKNGNKVDTILVHFESNFCCKNNDISDIINFIKNSKVLSNKKVGFAFIPIETSVNQIIPYLDDIDQLLILSVSPGFYGNTFIPDTISKINEIRKIKPDLDIEIDGGITPDTIKLVHDAGTNMFVSGSYIMNSENIKDAIDTLRCCLNE